MFIIKKMEFKRLKDNNSIIISNYGDVYREYKDGKIVKHCVWIDNLGRRMFCHNINGKKYYCRVYRKVAELFIPNPNNYPQVNHIDGNQLNDVYLNLEWVNNKQNTQHGYDNNLYKSTYRCPVKAIDKNTKEEIIFKSIRDMSNTLGCNRKTVTSILKGIKKNNNYNYEFEYLETQTTMGDECNPVG